MNHALKPYPEYKDAGVPWLREVPAHWEIRRGKTVFKTIDVRSQTGEEELLSVSERDGVIPRSQKMVTMFKAESYVGHKLCWPGDLVINSLWAWKQGLGFSRYYGLVSTAYGVYRPLSDYSSHWRFFDYLLRSKIYRWELRVRSKGIWLSRLQLTDNDFLDMPVIVPTEDEAEQIARFLDYLDRLARRYIRAQRRLIELLEEQKQALIQRAVTRGLDPDVPLKDSGIEWLGKIPEHWALKRFKFLAQISSGQIDPREEPYRDYILIAPNHIESGTGKISFEETAEAQGADSGKYLVKAGQVIYSKIRPNLRKAAIARTDCLCSADMYPISPKASELRPAYLLLILLSQPFTEYTVDFSLRVAMPKVNREALGDCWLWYPDLVEQDQILAWLAVELSPLDSAISYTQRQIDLIREYRTRLIADVVTGKLDVRGVALPGLDQDEGPDDFDDLEEEVTLDDLDAEEMNDADD